MADVVRLIAFLRAVAHGRERTAAQRAPENLREQTETVAFVTAESLAVAAQRREAATEAGTPATDLADEAPIQTRVSDSTAAAPAPQSARSYTAW
jgi:hypothetical protein